MSILKYFEYGNILYLFSFSLIGFKKYRIQHYFFSLFFLVFKTGVYSKNLVFETVKKNQEMQETKEKKK